jgi:hypothetical protein
LIEFSRRPLEKGISCPLYIPTDSLTKSNPAYLMLASHILSKDSCIKFVTHLITTGETTEIIVEACIHGEGKKCQLGKPSPQSHIHINPKEETSHKMLNYK